MVTKTMLERAPEPELMDSQQQVRAYAEADFSDANQRFVDLVLSQQALPTNGVALDLGCGPADLTLALAASLPGWRVTGLDAGSNMLATAKRNAAKAPSDVQARVGFVLGHLPEHGLDDPDFNLLVSNSLLHHLPDPSALWATLQGLGHAGTQVVVMDLFRPVDQATLDALVNDYAADEPEILQIDFANSLHAAWTVDEVRQQLNDCGLHQFEVRAISDRHLAVTGELAGLLD